METQTQSKKVDDFKKEFLKKSECIVGGTGKGDEGTIDRDKAGRLPTQGR